LVRTPTAGIDGLGRVAQDASMLSQKARYALRALIYLAERGSSAPTAAIAGDVPIPRKFLEQILLQLKAHRLVESRRGREGGYQLARPAGEISFADVIRVIDGPLALAPCASRTAYRPCQSCSDVETCPIRPILIQVRDQTAAILEGTTLLDRHELLS
jgi:Rrf2 family protein